MVTWIRTLAMSSCASSAPAPLVCSSPPTCLLAASMCSRCVITPCSSRLQTIIVRTLANDGAGLVKSAASAAVDWPTACITAAMCLVQAWHCIRTAQYGRRGTLQTCALLSRCPWSSTLTCPHSQRITCTASVAVGDLGAREWPSILWPRTMSASCKTCSDSTTPPSRSCQTTLLTCSEHAP